MQICVVSSSGLDRTAPPHWHPRFTHHRAARARGAVDRYTSVSDPRQQSSVLAEDMTESYSLWLMPSGPLAARLQQEIQQLAERVPDAPSFAPHVTLLGGIGKPREEVLRVTEQLAAQLQPYCISFDRVSSGSIFHQCVYILCNTEQPVMAAGAAAREAFGMDPRAHYMPHLSLLYSDIGQAEREALAAELQGRLLEGPDRLGETSFQVGSIAVWSTPAEDKSLKSWQLVKEIPLQQK